MQAYEGIGRVFDAEGVTAVFTYMAEDNLHLLAHLREDWADRVRLVHARHEQGAVAMADGYARATGDVGVCSVGRGPAVAQAAAPLVTACKHGSQLLAIVPESPTNWPYTQDHIKQFDQEPFLRSLVEAVIPVRSPTALLPNLAEGFRRIRAGDGPVVVQVAKDVFTADLPPDAPTTVAREYMPDPAPVVPNDAAVVAAVDELEAADRPVLLAGRGAVGDAETREAIADLADRVEAHLATTLPALGAFDGHPRALGMIGGFGSITANARVRRSDCLVAFGTSLSKFTTEMGDLVDAVGTLIHVDADRSSLGRYTPVNLAIHGDARLTANTIADGLGARGVDRPETPLASIPEAPDDESEPVSDGHPDGADPRELMTELDRLLPADRCVVTDVGHYLPWVYAELTIPEPRDLVLPLDFGVVGQGLPQAIGVSVGNCERTTLVFCGDGGFMMTLPELDTAVRHAVPLLVFVLNDQALGAEYHHLEKLGLPTEIAVMETPSFVAVAEAFGAEGYTVRSVDDLHALEDTIANLPDGPVVVDCRIDRAMRHRWMDPD